MITREMRFKKDFILEKIEEVKLNELSICNFVYSLSDDDKQNHEPSTQRKH